MRQEPSISELCQIIRESVGGAVSSALNSQEVWEIKETIKDVAREVTDEITGQIKSKAVPPRAGARGPRVYNTPTPQPDSSQAPKAAQSTGMAVWKGSPHKMKFKGNMMLVSGTIGATISGFFFAGMLTWIIGPLSAQATSAISVVFAGLASLIPFSAAVSFITLARRGGITHGMACRYQKYIETIAGDSFCPVVLLAESVGKKPKFVVKDLERMIKLGMFPQGRLDSEKTSLILDRDTYEKYLEAKKKMEECRKEEKSAPATPEEKNELEIALEDGRAYIRKMRQANEKIPGEEMSRKIDRIEVVCHRIFEQVEQHPEKLPDIRRFMSYYLPITVKLLEGYCKFDSQPVQGDNITTAKREIEETLDTVVVAFENLLDGLFHIEAMDLSSDISALEAMMAQEGLTGSDFPGDKIKSNK